ncbi:MAG: hypothetical protein WC942_12255 [Clostridia bacterium]
MLTLADEEEVCKNPRYAYIFALTIPSANVEKCQEAACNHPCYAHMFARDIPRASIDIGSKVCGATRYDLQD